jgi:hypothetical protein
MYTVPFISGFLTDGKATVHNITDSQIAPDWTAFLSQFKVPTCEALLNVAYQIPKNFYYRMPLLVSVASWSK